MGAMNDIFNLSPDQANNLTNFGFATMAASGRPGATTLGAIGEGGLGMNQAALQGAQSQLIQQEAQSRKLQNQLFPYQLQLAQFKAQQLQKDIDEDNNLSKPSGVAGQTWSNSAGVSRPMPERHQLSSQTNIDIPPAIFKNAQATGLDPALLHGVFMTESGGNINTPAGDGGSAIGPMQLHAGAAKDSGVTNRNDITQNLQGGATYLKQNIDRYKSPALGVLAYNWGPGNVDNWLKSGGDVNQIPQPQQDYVSKVANYAQSLSNPQQIQQQNDAIQLGSNLPKTSAEIENLQNRIDSMSRKLRIRENTGLPTTDLQINIKAAQEQLASALKTQQEVESAQPKASAGKEGENLADAQKTFNVAAGNLPRALQRFEQLRQASADASYGYGIDKEGEGRAPNFAKSSVGQVLEPKVAQANQVIQQASKQGILSELGPQLAGLRGNKFLESIASGASGLNADDPPPTKINAVNGLEDQYVANLKSLAAQRRNYGDVTVPTDHEIDRMVAQYKKAATIPKEAIEHLKSNPSLAQQFEAKYGVPSSQFIGQ